MCIICEGKYDEKTTKIDCSRCPLLQSIPLLPNLTELYCSRCPLIQSIPDLPKLTHLFCYRCPLLQSIPLLPKLTILSCSRCPLLRSIPPLPKISLLHCSGCPWLNNQENSDYKDNIEKLVKLQRRAKKTIKYSRFIKYIYSRSFTEWFFHPDGPGGKIHIKQIEKFYKGLSNTTGLKQ